MAQQAYRKRKETTINNLQTRVQELEVGIEQLSESLLSFSNLLLEVNLPNTHPHIANALQDITQKCVSLARNGLDDSGPAPPSYTATTTTTERKTSPTQNVNSNIDSEVSRSDNSASPIENFLQFPCTELLQWSSNSLPPTPHYQESSILPLGILLSSPPMQFADVSLSPSSLPGTLTSGNLLQQDQAPLSHLLVRECCRNGFRLLVEMYDNDSRIKEIFGSPLPLPERNRLISGLYYALRDDAVDVVDVKSRVLMPLHAKMNVFTPGQTARLIKSWQFVLGSAPGVWLDASDVQRFVQEKGLLAQDMDSPSSTASYDSPTFNMAVFIRRKYIIMVRNLLRDAY